MKALLNAAAAVATGLLLMHGGGAHAQATRTWVSGVGDDVNPCSRTAPCKTFAGAISKTATGGTINCLDPGGFGGVTIVKSVTIDCASTTAGVLVSATNAIVVNTPSANDVVTLRGLIVDGLGTGLSGIKFIGSGKLHVENCRIYGFRSSPGRGIDFVPNSTSTSELYVTDSVIADNGNVGVPASGGVVIRPSNTGGVNAVLRRVSLYNNQAGFVADGSAGTGGARAQIADSTATGSTAFGLNTFMIAGSGGVSVVAERTVLSGNGQHGALADGPFSQILLSNSVIVANNPGVAGVNGGAIFTYGNNAINANFGSDGTPIPSVLPQN